MMPYYIDLAILYLPPSVQVRCSAQQWRGAHQYPCGWESSWHRPVDRRACPCVVNVSASLILQSSDIGFVGLHQHQNSPVSFCQRFVLGLDQDSATSPNSDAESYSVGCILRHPVASVGIDDEPFQHSNYHDNAVVPT